MVASKFSVFKNILAKTRYFFTFFFFLSTILSKGQEPRLMLPIGHTNGINAGKFSPDGKLIATASEDFTAKIWNSRDGKLIHDLQGHTKEVMKLAFTPDGKLIATASWDNTAIIWSVLSGDSLLTLKHLYRVRDLKFSRNGDFLYTISDDEPLRCWNTNNGKLIFETEGHKEGINWVELSPDGKTILTCSSDKTAIVWDAITGKLILKLIGHKKEINMCVFSPDGKSIATVAEDNSAKIWDATTGKLLHSIVLGKLPVTSASFSPDSKNLVVTPRDFYIAKVFDVTSGKLRFPLKGHTSDVIDARYTPDGTKIISISYDQTIKIWNANDGNLIKELKDHENAVTDFAFSNDGRELLTTSADYTAKTWDLKSFNHKINFTGQSKTLLNAQFSKNGKDFITASDGAMVKNWETLTGKLQNSFTIDNQGLLSSASLINNDENILAFTCTGAQIRKALDGTLVNEILIGGDQCLTTALISPDQKSLLTTNFWNAVPKVWDVSTKKFSLALKGHDSKYGADIASYSPNGNQILTASTGPASDLSAKLWDAKTGNLIYTFKAHTFEIRFAKFSPDGKTILTAASDNSLKLWDVSSGKFILDLESYVQYISAVEFSPDGKLILGAGQNGAKIWNASTGKLVHELTAHTNDVKKALFFDDGKQVLTFAEDHTIKIWNTSSGKQTKNINVSKNTIFQSLSFDLKRIICTRKSELLFFDLDSGKELYSLVAFDADDFIIKLPSGYYMSTPNAAKSLYYVTKDLKVITFDQLDIRYNRPDKVLQAIGSTDTTLIQSYKKTYDKRIKKLGVDTTSFRGNYSVPEADFTNRNQIELAQNTQKLSIHIKGKDELYDLDRFNVWVNENPIFGMRGINLKAKKTHEIDTTIVINLSDGNNIIETSITNVNGTESYKMPLSIIYKPEKPTIAQLYFIGIGIDEFAQNQYNLKWSVKDIQDQAKALRQKYGERINIDTLFNQQVTVANIVALKQKLKTAGVNDKVIIAYSGHGLLNKDFDYFLSTYDVDFNKPEKNGLAYDILENLLDNIAPRQKLMLIDACHSGELDKEELLKINNAEQTLALNNTQGGKGIKVINTGNKKANMKSSLELMQQLFVNVGRSTGATVISAAAGTQFALEKNDLKNGVFSYSILEYMQANPHATVTDLKKYVNKRVTELTAGLQVPTTRNETKNLNWDVW